jgi:hypothetical protein
MLDIFSALEYTSIKPQEVEVGNPIISSGAKLNGNWKDLFFKGKLSGQAEMSRRW